MAACLQQSFVHATQFQGSECKVTLAYTPTGTLLDQQKWCERLENHEATTDAQLVQTEARALVNDLKPTRLSLKLEREGGDGEILQCAYAYTRAKENKKKRPRANKKVESDDGADDGY